MDSCFLNRIGDIAGAGVWTSFLDLIWSSYLSHPRTFDNVVKKSIIIWASIIAFGTVVLIATALYATFTPVESEWIAGCQPRYLIPIILVFFTFALNPRLKMRTHSVAYVFAFMGLVALMNAACSWFLIVSAVAA